jgi:predicted ATPase/DNA-binding CsgD family transcriptional regulator
MRPDVRLLTLSGPPGAGKTRLAMAAADHVTSQFPDGVSFVSLAPLSDPDLVTASIARCFGLEEARGRTFDQALRAHLSDKRLLLVLDCFEHVVSAAPEIAQLLSSCHGLKVLATSREALRLSWEHEIPVGPLAVPSSSGVNDPATLLACPSVAMFVSRAKAARHDFELNAENAAAVAEVCARLDGLPLAIELAAARTRLLSPGAIRARLGERFALLTRGAHDWPDRHRTLSSAIGWSYDLLSPPEQRLFRAVSVFVGGCTLQAIGAVSNLADDALDALASLHDKSLLRQEPATDDEPRFGMFETLAEFGRERLAELPDESDEVSRAHAQYFVALAETGESRLWGRDQAQCADILERDHDNMRAALRWSIEHDANLGLRLAGALQRFWALRGFLGEGSGWLDATLRAADHAPAEPRAKALNGAGNFLRTRGAFDSAAARYSESLMLYRSVDDQRGAATLLSNLGNLAYDRADFTDAREVWQESLQLRRALDDQRGVAMLLSKLGNAARCEDDLVGARALHEDSLLRFKEIGDEWGIAMALDDLGAVELCVPDLDRAKTVLEDSLTRFRGLRDNWGTAHALQNLGRAARLSGDLQQADGRLRESLALFHELGDIYDVSQVLDDLGQSAAARSDHVRAANLLSAAASLRERIGARLPPRDAAFVARTTARVRAALPPGTYARATRAAAQMEITDIVAEALREDTSGSVMSAAASSSPLTAREREVAVLLAHGRTNRQIAAELVIAERTAERHVENILGKLGLERRTQIGVWAVQQGLTSL